MKTSSVLVSLTLPAMAQISCRNVDDLSLRDAETLSLNTAAHAWPNKEIEVCFLNNSSDPRAKSLVQLALQRSFNRSSTFIEYFGFKDCEPGGKAPAKIRFGVSAAYSAQLGTQPVPISNPLGETIGLPTLENEFKFYNTVIHVFGHFAGLNHSNPISENGTKANCGATLTDKGQLLEMPINIKVGLPTLTDRTSIMNLCLDGFSSQYLRLSDDDVRKLRALYANRISTERESDVQKKSDDQTAYIDSKDTCSELKIMPADLAKIATRGYPTHTADGTAIYAYSDESFAEAAEIGTLKVGTIVTRVHAQPLSRKDISQNEEQLMAMLVVPKSGPLQGNKVWIIGNVAVVYGCDKIQD